MRNGFAKVRARVLLSLHFASVNGAIEERDLCGNRGELPIVDVNDYLGRGLQRENASGQFQESN